MAKKKKARSAPSRGYSKKRVSRPQRHTFFSESGDRIPTLSRPFDHVAQASIEKNREVLRELAKYWVRYLTTDEVIDLNRRVATESGGLFSVRDQHRIQYLVEIVQDEEQFPTVWDKAAMYVHRLATSQAFLDGN